MASGLPVMLEFIGRPFGDDLALRAALGFERATHHHSLWPDPARLPEVPPPLTADKNTA
jgi:Asp-tRNA(Asn)/Glu-tRNA(Gln) amidotransferase A subunit family amidase